LHPVEAKSLVRFRFDCLCSWFLVINILKTYENLLPVFSGEYPLIAQSAGMNIA
jgi:hypothetical protein